MSMYVRLNQKTEQLSMYGGLATPFIIFNVTYYSELHIAITFYW